MIPIKDNIPTDRFPVVTVAWIVANFVVYLLAIRHGGSIISGPDGQEIFKYGAGGNMLFLWIFGNNVEDSMGPIKYIGFYIVGGLAALALQVAIGPNSTAPTVGASGAIAAVLGGYIMLYPRARVLTLVFIILFFTVIELPALLMLGIWFVEQAAFATVGLTHPAGGAGGVAYFAHIGGFVFGWLAIRLLATNRKQVPPAYPVY